MSTRRWVDSLSDTQSTELARSADCIVWSIRFPKEENYLPHAGKILRNYRESVGLPTLREHDFDDSYSDDYLLWYALTAVAQAGKLDSKGAYVMAVGAVRWAEAALRTYWKRQQRKEASCVAS